MKIKLLLGIIATLLTFGAAGADSYADSPTSHRGLGKVIEVRGRTLTVVNYRGTFEILTDRNTIFRIRGVEDPSLKDIKVGDLVAGRVVKQEDGTLLAKVIALVPPRMQRLRRLGRVTEVRGHTLTVVNRRGTFQILTDRDTIFRIRGVEDPSLKDIEVGDLVAGRVVKQEDGTLLAKVIALVPPRMQRLRSLGRVTEVRGHTFTVVNRRGTFGILTDRDTIFGMRSAGFTLASV